MNGYQDFVDKALRDEILSRSQCQDVLNTSDEELLGLLQAAFRVRFRYFGKTVRLQMLQNAKSGACQEDCHYCSQSAVSTAAIERYNLVPQKQMIEGARQAAASKAQRYCIVISGRSPLDREIDEIAGAVRAIKNEIPIQICCSLGLMNETQAKRLKAAGVDRVNHNLNTSRRFYPEICSTHTFDDRMQTLQAVREAGMELCSGGIVGMGEQHADLVDLALTLRELEVESIPVNFLHPIDGTPLAQRGDLNPRECLRALCLFRLANPRSEIRIAGGRELHLRSLQPLGLYAANSLFVSDYLTTPGQSPEDDYRMIADLGFVITGPGPETKKGQDPAVAGKPAERMTATDAHR